MRSHKSRAGQIKPERVQRPGGTIAVETPNGWRDVPKIPITTGHWDAGAA